MELDALDRVRRVADAHDDAAVAAHDGHLCAALAHELIQVVGKAVVVVDEQDIHATTSSFTGIGWRPSMRSASATAESTACALLSVSWYSVDGFESATMPAPAW